MVINWVDLIVLFIILFNVFLGFKRGIIAEILTLLGLISAIFIAIFWYADLSNFFIHQFKWNPALLSVISFILIFIVVILFFRVLENILVHITALLLLNWINNLGGALFGFIRGTIIVGLLFLIFALIPLPVEIEYQIKQSFLARYFLEGVAISYQSLKEWLPQHFQFEMDFLKERLFSSVNT